MDQRLPLVGQLARQTEVASEWSITVKKCVPKELADYVQRARLNAGQLVVFTESAAWAARLRYALAESADQLRDAHAEVHEIVVRVSPRSP